MNNDREFNHLLSNDYSFKLTSVALQLGFMNVPMTDKDFRLGIYYNSRPEAFKSVHDKTVE